MQTFLPYPNFQQSVKVLDNKRLGKQRVEAKQIINTLLGTSVGWKNHPAVKMWKGYIPALALYGYECCQEWRRRGFKDSLEPFFVQYIMSSFEYPEWFGDVSFHSSHRSNLLRKDKIRYSLFGWTEDPSQPYIWPSKENDKKEVD